MHIKNRIVCIFSLGFLTSVILLVCNTTILMSIRSHQILRAESSPTSTGNDGQELSVSRCDNHAAGYGVSPSIIYPLFSPEFGRLITVKAKIMLVNNKGNDLKLEVTHCNGVQMPHVYSVAVDCLSSKNELLHYIGEIRLFVGYESVEVGGVPAEILANGDIQATTYFIRRSFVITTIL